VHPDTDSGIPFPNQAIDPDQLHLVYQVVCHQLLVTKQQQLLAVAAYAPLHTVQPLPDLSPNIWEASHT
jgi:hypothetical protein